MLTARLNPATGLFHLVGASDALVTATNQFLETLAGRGFSPLTIKSYAFAIARFHRWFAQQGRSFEELRQADLVLFIAELRAEGAQPRTINHRLAVVRSLFHVVVGRPMKWGTGVCPPPPRNSRGGSHDRRLGLHWVKMNGSHILRVKTPQTLIEPLTPDQVKAFLKTFHRYRDLALVHMMLLCGLRSREALGMRMDDINTVDRCLRVLGKACESYCISSHYCDGLSRKRLRSASLG